MEVEEAIRAYLADQSAIVAQVKTRVFVEALPQSVPYPAIRVKLVSDPREHHLRGQQKPTQARVQVDAYQDESSADAYSRAAIVAQTVFAAIDGRKFTIDDGSPPSRRVTGCFMVSRRSMREVGPPRLVRISQDFLITSFDA